MEQPRPKQKEDALVDPNSAVAQKAGESYYLGNVLKIKQLNDDLEKRIQDEIKNAGELMRQAEEKGREIVLMRLALKFGRDMENAVNPQEANPVGHA